MICSCGKSHTNQIEKICVKASIQTEINNDLIGYSDDQVIIVTDEPVKAVYHELVQSLNRFEQLILKRSEVLIPDETAIGEILLATSSKTRLIIGIGSGSINDLCRYISFRVNIPYWIVMSAPSMDGYASTASPIITHGFKHTFYCHIARRLYGDEHILKGAPIPMILAGIGDLLGKITALMDWQLSHILSEEYICFEIINDLYQRIDQLIETLFSNANLPNKSLLKELSAEINEHLIQSGIYMSYVGNSRPASGSEHLVSHCLEMKGLALHQTIDFHGLKVGMATYYMLKLYQQLQSDLTIVSNFYQLSTDKKTQLEAMISKGLRYLEPITLFQSMITPIMRDYTKTELIEAMIQGPTIRDRYTILTVFKELDWFDKLETMFS